MPLKRRLKVALYISSILVFLILCTTVVFADGSVNIDRYTIFAEIGEDGSMNVEEIITYNFKGSFNGARRELDFTGASDIENLNLYLSTQIAPDDLANVDLKEFQIVDEASVGDSGVVTVEEQNNQKNIMIYSPSEDERKTFVIKYTLKNVVNRYQDIAEFYWQFIPSGWDFEIENVDVHIKVPEGAKVDDLRIFGHGPLTGESKRIDGQNVILTAPSIKPGEFLEVRLLFPTKLVPDMEETISENALEGILAEEEKWAEEANIKRQSHRRAYIITSAIVGILVISNIIMFIYIYIKYDREYRVDKDIKYYRELPGDYSPAEMSALYNFGSINSRDVTATLMDLVRRGYLKLETVNIEKRGLFGRGSKEDYVFIKLKEPDEELSAHEEYLFKWLIESVGNGISMKLEDLDKYTKSTSGARKFQEKYSVWKDMVKQEAGDRGFFDENIVRGKLLGGLFAVVEIVASIYIVHLGNYVGVITLILGIVFLIYSFAFNRRSPYGAQQYNLWKAFRRFLLDFSNIKEYTPPSIVIWEHYLVYAISLGVAKEVIKQLKVVISPEEFYNPSLTYLYTSNMSRQFMMMDRIDNVTTSFEKTINTAISRSATSSTTGTGGGFSGGGGGGGGSGGGGGAF